ncbi:MAG: putative transposase [Burkholderiales bacterium]
MSESSGRQPELFPGHVGVSDAIVINDRCLLRVEGDHRVVVCAGIAVAHFRVGDRVALALAMVQLIEQGWADQNDVAHAFGCSARTLRRHQRRYDEGGTVLLARTAGYPKGRCRVRARDQTVAGLKAQGLSTRAIAHRLGLDEKSVRKRLRRLGWKPLAAEQMSLDVAQPDAVGCGPNLSAFVEAPVETPSETDGPECGPNLSAFSVPAADAEPLPWTADDDPADRRWDRLFAYFGLLDDAAPLFRDGAAVPGAGVLLALPALLPSDVLAAARKVYGSIGPAFYGLRTTIVTLLLMALLRIKRPEALKERSPADLGRVLGLDRAPEVKTIRRKLTRLAALGGAVELGHRLAQRRVALRGESLGFLYADGHVRVYHGQRTLPKAHVARMRLAAPATTDYWVNDLHGDPLFVVTAEANAGMVKMLPLLLGDIRKLVGERRVTVVFDRGGWSFDLFSRILTDGFDLLTYRKGKSRRVPARCFQEHAGTFDGRQVRYQLADQGVRLRNGLRLRQVTRLKDGHQTPILTSRRDLPAVEVAYRMFERWRQENFFKYLREEFLLDALVDYQVEPADPAREVPNPAWAAVDAQVRQVRAEIEQLQRHYGYEALANVERQRPTMRGFKIAHGKLRQSIWGRCQRLLDLQKRRARTPRRLPVGHTADGEVIQLATERKHLTNVIKLVAYQAESDLVRALALHYKRHEDEGRTLVQTALASAADIQVSDTELRLTLAPLSSPHRSRAIAALCADLNATATIFPGTRLRLRYAVAGLP